MLNDIVKLNDFQICYISIKNETNDYFQLILLSLYKNDQLINIKYYQIEMTIANNMKISNQLKASLYNQYISIAFTYTYTTSSSKRCSLIIFNYPNSEDNELDLILQLYTTVLVKVK